MRGVLAPESANIAQEGGHLIPTLLFGIPASGSMALLLSGFILIGIKPGIDMVTSNLELTYTIVWSLTIANVIGTAACVLLSPTVAKLTTVPSTIIAPLMFVLIFFAASQATHSWNDLFTLMGVGVFSTYLRRFGWPRPAFMIGFVLSTQLENGIYRVIEIYQWSFLSRPVVIVLAIIILGSLAAALWFREAKVELDDDGVHTAKGRIPQVAFFALVAAAAVFAFSETLHWDYAAALFPRTIAIATIVLMVPIGLLMLRSRNANTVFFDAEREAVGGTLEHQSSEYYLLWLLGYMAMIALVGFVLASAAFVYIFMRSKAGLSHWKCAAYTAFVLVVLGATAYALGSTYIEGVLQAWIPLPWPFN